MRVVVAVHWFISFSNKLEDELIQHLQLREAEMLCFTFHAEALQSHLASN
jgi:hypothetical protein